MIDFFQAAKAGAVAEIERLLKRGADVNQCKEFEDHKLVTPLMLAAKHDAADVVRLLLDAGAKIEATDHNGRTALMFASEFNNEETIKVLLDSGADPSISHNGGVTALMLAAAFGTADIVDLLLKHGANPNAATFDGSVPDTFAEEISSERQDLSYLISVGAIAEINYSNGWTALHYAAWKNPSVDVAEILIRDGSELNTQTLWGETPLLLAVKNRNYEIANLLLESWADANVQKDDDGRTALHYATQQKAYDTIISLVNHGADVNIRDKYGKTPLMYSTDPNITNLLIGNGAEPVKNDENTEALLRIARQKAIETIQTPVEWGRFSAILTIHYDASSEIVKSLIAAGADVNAHDEDGITPLMWAAKCNSPRVCKLLLDAGADPTALDRNGCNVLERGHLRKKIFNLLKRYGAKKAY